MVLNTAVVSFLDNVGDGDEVRQTSLGDGSHAVGGKVGVRLVAL